MNIVEFALKFKDLASGPLRNFGASARQTFTNAENLANSATRGNRRLGQSYDELGHRVRNTRREIEAMRNAQSQGGKTGGFNPMGLIKGAGLLTAGYMVANAIGASINKGMERQQIQTSFNVLTGSEQAGGALTKQLVALQKDTVLGSEVFKNAQTMLGFGFKDTEVLSNMKMLGDVSMGNAEKMGALTLAFSQVRAGGKLTGQDLLQFINAGFNPLEQISQSTGKSMAVLKEEMAAGGISFGMVQQAFKDATSEGGRFNGMLEKIAQTPAGKKAAFMGAVDEIITGFGNAFMPMVTLALDFGNKMLPVIESFIQPLTSGMQWLASTLRTIKPYLVEMLAPAVEFMRQITSETEGWMDYLMVIKTVFIENIYPVVKKLVSTVFSMVSQLVTFVKNSEMLKDTFRFIYWVVGKLWDVLGLLIDYIAWFFNTVYMPILNAIESAYRLLTGKGAQASGGKAKIPVYVPPEKKKEDENLAGLMAENTKAVQENTKSAQTAEKAITSGGPRVVNITVQKFLDSININSTNLPSAVGDIEQQVLELFARVVAQGARTA